MMNNKSCCKQTQVPRRTNAFVPLLLAFAAAALFVCPPQARAGGDAPQWMHAQVNATLPTYDEKTDAVLLYSETNVTVISTDKIKTTVREAYKILRPNGRQRGTFAVYYNPGRKIKGMHGWCIPAQGKDYEVKDKDAVEIAVEHGGELVTDTKFRVLTIPAADPGNIVGYEYEVEERPFFLQNEWYFQERDPVRESHYSLALPAGWEYKTWWLNSPEIKASEAGNNTWKWTINDVKGIRSEPAMPPMSAVAGQMVVTFFPPGGKAATGFAGWDDMGKWYGSLLTDRLDASAPIQQEVKTLTADKTTPLAKMQAIAQFIQHDIRYVAIELGIGGWQPHPATDVFSNHYGDCKDKATLMRSMLHQAGIESYHVVINNHRGVVTRESPPHNGFNHVVLAIRLPEGLSDPSLVATVQHPKLGTLLYFDPTDEVTPFGQISGELQDNYALLVTENGGELLPLPQQPTSMNSIARTGKLTLDANGTLKGQVTESRLGERAWTQRWIYRTTTKDSDRIKPIEELLGAHLTSFQITHASVLNMTHTDLPFGYDYSFVSANYAKNAGGLLLVRPRVLGSKALNTLETKEPRKFPIELEEPTRDTDVFEITIPPGYQVDDTPPPVDLDYSFASYHSKTEIKENVIRYSRTFEVKQLSVPVDHADELKRFYRTINGDERNTVVLKAAAH